MTAERWRAVQETFAAVRALSPEARREFLSNDGVAGEVRAEVERLLRHHDTADGILDAGSDQVRAEVSNLVNEAAPLTADPLLGSRVGRYHVKSVIARGGMATVYEAVQESPHRVVALKVMKQNIASQTALRRFQFESQILARLRHPNIAQIFEAGVATVELAGGKVGAEPGGNVGKWESGKGADETANPPSSTAATLASDNTPEYAAAALPTFPLSHVPTIEVPYFAMEYIPGAKPITDYAAAKDLDLPRRLALFAKVCDAVHHGHVKGIIHRDLKPANILVTEREDCDDSENVGRWEGGNVRTAGQPSHIPTFPPSQPAQPKIIDFGVARATDSDLAVTTQQTSIGDLVGTMQYMSPEQCDADPHDIDTRSDVYSLGVVLYELLTGVLPYDAAGSTIHAMHQAPGIIRNVLPPQPSTVVARGVNSCGVNSFGECGRLVRAGAQSPPAAMGSKPGRHVSGETPALPGRSAARHAARALRGDVDTIVAKALAKDRNQRYASAAELAADVRRYLNREPIAARAPSRWERAVHWVQKHPASTTTLVCLSIATIILAGTLASVWLVSSRPHTYQRFLDSQGGVREFRIISLAGHTIESWTSEVEQGLPFADVVADDAGKRWAVVAITGMLDRPFKKTICVYDFSGSLTVPAHRLAIEVGDWLPDPHQRGYTPQDFGVVSGTVADVFDEYPGKEIVAVFQHHTWSQSLIRIYDLSGRLLYQVWDDAVLKSCCWSEKHRQLIFAGVDGETPWVKRGVENAVAHYPTVVMALEPRCGTVDRTAEPPTARSVARWYRCLWPIEEVNLINWATRVVPELESKDGDVGLTISVNKDELRAEFGGILDHDGQLIRETIHGNPEFKRSEHQRTRPVPDLNKISLIPLREVSKITNTSVGQPASHPK